MYRPQGTDAWSDPCAVLESSYADFGAPLVAAPTLSASAADWGITGQNLRVDGGLTRSV